MWQAWSVNSVMNYLNVRIDLHSGAALHPNNPLKLSTLNIQEWMSEGTGSEDKRGGDNPAETATDETPFILMSWWQTVDGTVVFFIVVISTTKSRSRLDWTIFNAVLDFHHRRISPEEQILSLFTLSVRFTPRIQCDFVRVQWSMNRWERVQDCFLKYSSRVLASLQGWSKTWVHISAACGVRKHEINTVIVVDFWLAWPFRRD